MDCSIRTGARIEYIDVLRGFAIFIVVFGHWELFGLHVYSFGDNCLILLNYLFSFFSVGFWLVGANSKITTL